MSVEPVWFGQPPPLSTLRVEVDVGKVRWLILPRMMEVAGDIYEKVRRSK